jgi:hypothetical protein
LIQRLPDVARPDSEVLVDLKMLEFEANEIPGLMEGEADMRLGKWKSWEEVRKELGI